jgi:hypothetical protein
VSDTIIEAPIVLTLKCNDSKDAPWLVLRATNVQQLQSQLQELENCTVFADIGRVAATFQAQAVLGAVLEAKGLDPAVDGGSFNGVKAATTQPSATAAPSAPAEQPKTAAPAFPAFGGFKTPAPAATPPTAPATSAPRPAAEPPAAAPAANGFPAAPQWKKS